MHLMKKCGREHTLKDKYYRGEQLMGNPNAKRNILAILAILLLLGLLGGMIWYDRQSKLSVNQEGPSYTQTTVNKDTTSESDTASSEEASDDTSGKENDQETVSPQNQQEASQQTITESPALANLEMKDTASDFQPQSNKVTIRSLGGVTLSQSINQMANSGNEMYQETLKQRVEEGYQPSEDSQHGYDFGLMLEDVAPYVGYADVTIGQMNQPVAYPQLPQSDFPTPNAPSAIFNDLQEMGVDYVALASGHIYDKGASGIQASISNAKNAKLNVLGAFTSQEDMDTARIEEINGIKVGFLSYTMDLNGNLLAEGETHLTSFFTQDMMAEEISALKSMADAVVVNVYTSEQTSTETDEHVTSTLQTIADAGATVIIGQNPNALQPFAWLNDKATLVLYSQASFLTNTLEADAKVSGIFDFTLAKSGDQVVVENAKFMPTITLGTDNDQYFRTVPLADYQKFEIPEGQSLWQTIVDRMNSNGTDIEIVSHLETNQSVEQVDTHR